MSFIRKPNRLPIAEVYQKDNWYFVTICTLQRKCIFVEAMPSSPCTSQPSSQFKLNNIGKIIENTWLRNQEVYEGVILDDFVIMPNHIHAIIGFEKTPYSKINRKDVYLGEIIKAFKKVCLIEIKKIANQNTNSDEGIASTKHLIQTYKTIWQKSFYDHVIRNEQDLQRIREYIYNNPLKWQTDELNPVNKLVA